MRSLSVPPASNLIGLVSLLSSIVVPSLARYNCVPSVAAKPVLSFDNLILGFAE